MNCVRLRIKIGIPTVMLVLIGMLSGCVKEAAGSGAEESHKSDVEGLTALTYLNCEGNELTGLDISNNTALTGLYCYRNNLTSLDIGENIALTYLDCSENKLTSLITGENAELTILYCNDNELAGLDISGCTGLGIESLIYDEEKVTVTGK